MLLHSLENRPTNACANRFLILITSCFDDEIYLGKIQAGSLAGAAHLLKDNAGVQRSAHLGQKPRVEDQAKCWFDLYFQYKY